MGVMEKADLVAAVSKIQEPQSSLAGINLDAAFIQMCKETGPPAVNLSTSTVVTKVHSTLLQAGSTITAAEVQTAFSVLMPSSQLSQ
jgi:hypothetical protein